MVSGKLYVVCCIDSWKIVKDQLNPNPCAAPAFFSLDLCQIVQINRLPRTDSAPIVPSWYGEWTVDGQLKLSSGMVYLECNNLVVESWTHNVLGMAVRAWIAKHTLQGPPAVYIWVLQQRINITNTSILELWMI